MLEDNRGSECHVGLACLLAQQTAAFPSRPDSRCGAWPFQGKPMSRRGFLTVVGTGAAVVICYVAAHRESDKPSGGPDQARPTRAEGMIGAVEPSGTLLVTRGGRGAEADYGCRLNPVAGEIWHLADGKHTVEQMAQAISRKFNVHKELALADARSFVELLVNHRFLVRAGA